MVRRPPAKDGAGASYSLGVFTLLALLGQVDRDMRQQMSLQGVDRVYPVRPDQFVTGNAHGRGPFKDSLPDVHRVLAGLEKECAGPSQPQLAARKIEPHLLPYFPPGRLLRRLAPMNEAARQRVAIPVARADQKHSAAVPQGHARPVCRWPTHEPPRPQPQIGQPVAPPDRFVHETSHERSRRDSNPRGLSTQRFSRPSP
jgi:hypothetical protein